MVGVIIDIGGGIGGPGGGFGGPGGGFFSRSSSSGLPLRLLLLKPPPGPNLVRVENYTRTISEYRL